MMCALLLFALPICLGSRNVLGALRLHPPEVTWHDSMIDHFNWQPHGNHTFKQKILTYRKEWSADGPILLYLGNEGQIEDFYNATGFMFDVARELGALVVFIEHRYYGESLPFGSSSFTTNNIGLLTVEQAMADYVEFVASFRTSLACSQNGCKTILFGGSYGGMLVAWFRARYPWLSVGGLAASASVNFYPTPTGLVQDAFYNATMHTYKRFGGVAACDTKVQHALKAVRDVGETPSGLKELSEMLHVCSDLSALPSGLEKLEFYIMGALATLAMADYPYPCDFITPMVGNPVQAACKLFPPSGSSNKALIGALNGVLGILLNGTGTESCRNVSLEVVGHYEPSSSSVYNGDREDKDSSLELEDISIPWQYQACTEMLLMPLTTDGNGFYPPSQAQLPNVIAWCQRRYRVAPRPLWLARSTGRGDYRAATNLIFSTCEKDPWHTGATPEEMGSTVVHIEIAAAAHHQDLRFPDPADSASVTKAREEELLIFRKWLNE